MAQKPQTQEETPAEEAGKIGRLANEARGLVDDTRDWVDAKLRLFELDMERKVDDAANRVVGWGVIGLLAALALTFTLTAAALALGELWGNSGLGFLAVAGVSLLLALVVYWVKPRFVRGAFGAAGRRDVAKLDPADTTKQLPPPKNGATDA